MSTQERSVILKAHEVRGILEGRLIQIRRIVKPQPESAWGQMAFRKKVGYWLYPNAKNEVLASAPLGTPGDRVWVKEGVITHASIPQLIGYAADGCKPTEHWEKYRDGSHMPRWASRITLEITDVSVEQVDGMWVWVYDVRRCV